MKKSSFLSQLQAQDNDDGTRTLITPFVYHFGWLNGGATVTVPKGFTFNGASVPKVLHSYIHPWHPMIAKAACLHDFMYAQQLPRWFADRVLYESMGVLKAPLRDRVLVYTALRLFGWKAYRESREERKPKQIDVAEVIEGAAQAISSE